MHLLMDWKHWPSRCYYEQPNFSFIETRILRLRRICWYHRASGGSLLSPGTPGSHEALLPLYGNAGGHVLTQLRRESVGKGAS